MLRLTLIMTALLSFAFPASSNEWPESARLQMEAAGARMSAASTTAERGDAMREIEAIAAAHPDAPDARILARLLSDQATIESGPGAMLDALRELAASGQITDIESFAGIAKPLMETIADMHESAPPLGSVAIALDDAVSKLNATAAKAGLPSVADAISQFTGDEKLGSAITNSLNRISSAAKIARSAPSLVELDEKAIDEFTQSYLKILSGASAFAINPGGTVVIRDIAIWNTDMYREVASGINLVSNAIQAGEFNHAEYNKIHQHLQDLAKGPWDSDTAKDVFGSLCKSIPVAKSWCNDIFSLAENLEDYRTDFTEDPSLAWSSATIGRTLKSGNRFLGEFGNGEVRLDLKSKGSSVTVTFDLLVLKSWDGNAPGYGPDIWSLSTSDGQTLIRATFSNVDEDPYYYTQSYPAFVGAGDNAAMTGSIARDSMGDYIFGDSTYRLSFSFTPKSDRFSLIFQGEGLEDIMNESWGLDNIVITGASIE